MAKLHIEDVALKGKRVLMRVDFNVPLNAQGEITDDTRIKASLPTINYVLKNGAKVILISHLGRPDGVEDKLRLNPVAKRLEEILDQKVIKLDDCIGPEAEKASRELEEGQIILLENVRFHKEEEKNDPSFAQKLSNLADIFVNDAFATCHRAHASTVGITKFLTSCSGYLLKEEIVNLQRISREAKSPFVAIIGGAKISGKIGVITNLLPRVSFLLIGGAMAYTLLKAKGEEIGDSLLEEDKLDLAAEILNNDKEAKIHLPIDHIAAKDIRPDAETKEIDVRSIPAGWKGVDIGKKTIEEYKEIIMRAETIFWNGPMGIFEIESFAWGTLEIGRAIARAKAYSIAGGGDTIAAINKAGVAEEISHISTGGGASLEYLEGKALPGIAALSEKE